MIETALDVLATLATARGYIQQTRPCIDVAITAPVYFYDGTNFLPVPVPVYIKSPIPSQTLKSKPVESDMTRCSTPTAVFEPVDDNLSRSGTPVAVIEEF